jgi:hypothetical protein
MLGTAEPPAEEAVVVTPPAPVRAVLWAPLGEVFEARERPGATADTNAAIPAVSAAVATIAQRRVRRTRSSAASRNSAARERSDPGLIGVWPPIVLSLSAETGSAQ